MISASDRSCLFAMYNIPLKHLRLKHHGMGKMQCIGYSFRYLRCISQTFLFSPVIMNSFNILPRQIFQGAAVVRTHIQDGDARVRGTTVQQQYCSSLHYTLRSTNLTLPRVAQPLPLPFHVDQRTDRQLTSFLYSEGAKGLAELQYLIHTYRALYTSYAVVNCLLCCCFWLVHSGLSTCLMPSLLFPLYDRGRSFLETCVV